MLPMTYIKLSLMFRRALLLIVALALASCSVLRHEELYPKYVKFPDGATLDEKVDMISRLVPTPQQLEWQQMELTAFLHFGINTFTGNEWGDGTDDPCLFNPTNLDCEQWVRSLQDAGFKMVILTAKHHDGFCLWPTATTEYSVKNSAWRNGNGDVVRELRDACDKYGMKFGLYLSPWDRNAECYGDSPRYNKLFIAQLTELLTLYGDVHEVWFDGACAEGANGRVQEYDWDSILATIRRWQPHAVTAIMGDDVRWVGNEGGLGRDTEWSATLIAPGSYSHKRVENERLGLQEMSKDLGSRSLIAKANEAYWYPSEVDVSIRPGWFYHPEQNRQVRSLANLVDIYFRSVGCNSVLLLNIPPNRRGLLDSVDVERVKALSEYLRKTFADNRVIGGDMAWDAEVGQSKEYDVVIDSRVNTLLIQEDISRGQRVEEFAVEVCVDGVWRSVAEATTIGYKRLLRFEDITPERLRITVRGARGVAHISNVGLYYAEPLVEGDAVVSYSDVATTKWRVACDDACAAIDGDGATSWSVEGLRPLVVDMGEEVDVAGFCYAPDSQNMEGTIYRFNFFVSDDGNTWRECVADGEFSNIMHNPVPYFVYFGNSHKARYFKLQPLRAINDELRTTISEVGILL